MLYSILDQVLSGYVVPSKCFIEKGSFLLGLNTPAISGIKWSQAVEATGHLPAHMHDIQYCSLLSYLEDRDRSEKSPWCSSTEPLE